MKNNIIDVSISANKCILTILDSYLGFIDYVIDNTDNESLVKIAKGRKEDWIPIQKSIQEIQDSLEGKNAEKKKSSDA